MHYRHRLAVSLILPLHLQHPADFTQRFSVTAPARLEILRKEVSS